MDTLDNINLSWNEVTEKCLKEEWKNVWPELNKDVDRRESIVDIDEIVKLANEIGLYNINAQDIETLLQVTTDESLFNVNLKKLVEQVHEDNESNVSEDEERKELSTDFLKKSLVTITEIMDQFVKNDLNFERSSKARRSVIDALSCYRRLIDERNRKRQTTLDEFFTKKTKSMTNEREPPSSQTQFLYSNFF